MEKVEWLCHWVGGHVADVWDRCSCVLTPLLRFDGRRWVWCQVWLFECVLLRLLLVSPGVLWMGLKKGLTYGHGSVPIAADDTIDFGICAQLLWRKSSSHDGKDVAGGVVVGCG